MLNIWLTSKEKSTSEYFTDNLCTELNMQINMNRACEKRLKLHCFGMVYVNTSFSDETVKHLVVVVKTKSLCKMIIQEKSIVCF